jgi:hypothetical protein
MRFAIQPHSQRLRFVSDKQFKIPASNIKPLVAGRGFCIATDAITVEGRKVGYMYREEPDSEQDSGWRFFSGSESQEYLEDAGNADVYDVNTIANYDAAIIPLLDSPVRSAFERRGLFKKFVAVPFEAPEEEGE